MLELRILMRLSCKLWENTVCDVTWWFHILAVMLAQVNMHKEEKGTRVCFFAPGKWRLLSCVSPMRRRQTIPCVSSLFGLLLTLSCLWVLNDLGVAFRSLVLPSLTLCSSLWPVLRIILWNAKPHIRKGRVEWLKISSPNRFPTLRGKRQNKELSERKTRPFLICCRRLCLRLTEVQRMKPIR